MKKRMTFWKGCLFAMVMFSFFLGRGAGAADRIIAAGSPVLNRIIENGVIRVGVNPLFKPFSFIDASQKRVGIDLDIARLLADELGVKLEIVAPDSFAKLIPMLLDDKIDIIMAGMTRNFKRAKLVNFTDAYFDTGLSILFNKVKASQLGIPSVKTYQELAQKLKQTGNEARLEIAVTENKSPARSVPLFFPKSIIKKYPTNEKAAQAVINGDAHIMVHDEMFLKVWLQDHKGETLYKAYVFDHPFKPDYYSFAIRKGNQEFLNMLNVFVAELGVEDYLHTFIKNYLD